MNSKKFAKRMKDSGVSPVIATILMVAITVVLAAVLYVMVSGFTHSPGTANSVGLSSSATNSGFVVTVDKVSSSTLAYNNLKIEITNATGNVLTYIISGSATPATVTSAHGIAFTFTNSGSDISAGDAITLAFTGWTSTSGLTFSMYDGNSALGSITLQ